MLHQQAQCHLHRLQVLLMVESRLLFRQAQYRVHHQEVLQVQPVLTTRSAPLQPASGSAPIYPVGVVSPLTQIAYMRCELEQMVQVVGLIRPIELVTFNNPTSWSHFHALRT